MRRERQQGRKETQGELFALLRSNELDRRDRLLRYFSERSRPVTKKLSIDLLNKKKSTDRIETRNSNKQSKAISPPFPLSLRRPYVFGGSLANGFGLFGIVWNMFPPAKTGRGGRVVFALDDEVELEGVGAWIGTGMGRGREVELRTKKENKEEEGRGRRVIGGKEGCRRE